MAAKGIIMNHTDELMIPINNRLEEDEDDDEAFISHTGLDNAIEALNVGGSSSAGSPKMKVSKCSM